MKRFMSLAGLAATLLWSVAAMAAEQTVTLDVANMYCAACPATVQRSLSAVPGVTKVVVSFEKKTAVVTFDDQKATLAALVAAPTNAGYPTKLAAAQTPKTQ
ncbi:MAG: mercury resistance system periplasmic binding protein MerP [Hyphomicrobiales bacterium]|nr:MAG: mercury resistance system periplasmic binding protein MerP [Hyphomicrobiales bacterium]